MKTVIVISEFVDKYNPSHLYKVGEIVSFDDERAADMVARNLAEYKDEPKKEESKPAPKAEPEVESKEEVKTEEKPKPAIAKPLNKRPKEVSNGINKQGK